MSVMIRASYWALVRPETEQPDDEIAVGGEASFTKAHEGNVE